jgi:hypothetical protein
MDQLTFTPQLGLIIGGLIGLALGWVIGFFDSNKRTENKIKAAEANAEIAVKEAEKKIAEANQLLSPAAEPIIQDEPGLLRLKNDSGRYALEMDGTPITGALSSDGRKRLIELLTVIRPYLEGGLPPQAPPAAPAYVAPPASQNAAPAYTAPVVKPVAPPPMPSSVAPIPATLAASFAPEIKKPEDEKNGKDLSIVAQINSVLQERLLNTTLAKRGIRLSESPEGGVEVYVGVQKFEAVDDVTDPEVKAVIRAAITAWEKKSIPESRK